MKRILLTLMAFLLMIFGGLTFAQEKDWIEYDSGTITVYSPDGSYGIVIQDRNLGATMTGGGKNAPVGSYGYYYQWGNNYGFEPSCYTNGCTGFVGEITTTGTKLDASGFGPGNYYNSNVFVYEPAFGNGDWSSIQNDNLWGGEGDDETNLWGLTSNNPITGRQGPCPEGYHIPSIGELNELLVIWANNEYAEDFGDDPLTIEELWSLADDETPLSETFSEDLLIPFAGVRWAFPAFNIDGINYVRVASHLLSSSPVDYDGDPGVYLLYPYSALRGNPPTPYYRIESNHMENRVTGMSIRCFKNERVYRATSKTLTLNVMSGENLVSTGVSFTDDEPLTSGQVLEAIDWLSNEIELATGYHFERYTDDEGVETGFDLNTAISEGIITSNLALTGKIEPNKYTISFLDESGDEIMSGEFTYGQETTLPTNTSTKEGYTFKGWKDGQGNTYEDGATIKNLTTENGAVLEFNPIREQNPKPSTSSGGGSGGRRHRNSTTNTGNDITSQSGNQIDFATSDGDHQEILGNGYSREFNDAYAFAYKYGITTMKSIEEANMHGGLNRIAMAKMLASYAINVLGKKPDTNRIPNFLDVSDNLDNEYNNGVTLAYQLGIMGINMGDKFRPFDLVPRSEFVTALSRMKYNTPDGKTLYYSTHMKLLNNLGIVTNTDPKLQEIRGYVMLMLMRSTLMKSDTTGDNQSGLDITSENELEVVNYFNQPYKKGSKSTKIGNLQDMLRYYGYYEGEINNTYDSNTISAIYKFQIDMGIIDANDTNNSAKGWMGPATRDDLNIKRAEYQLVK